MPFAYQYVIDLCATEIYLPIVVLLACLLTEPVYLLSYLGSYWLLSWI